MIVVFDHIGMEIDLVHLRKLGFDLGDTAHSMAFSFSGNGRRPGRGGVSPVLMIRKRIMSAGVFHEIALIDDVRLSELFAREVLAMLVEKELLSPEWAERLLSWRHSGFNVHSLVRTETKAISFVAERPPPEENFWIFR